MMDLLNNRVGLKITEDLRKSNSATIEKIEETAIKVVKSGKATVLRPGNSPRARF